LTAGSAGLTGGAGVVSTGGSGCAGTGAGTGAGEGGVGDGGAPMRSDSHAVRANSAPMTIRRRSMMIAVGRTMRGSISQRSNGFFSDGAFMLWLVFEAGVALAILVFIVWWTWPRPPRDGDGG